jgi:hypothetical protein
MVELGLSFQVPADCLVCRGKIQEFQLNVRNLYALQQNQPVNSPPKEKKFLQKHFPVNSPPKEKKFLQQHQPVNKFLCQFDALIVDNDRTEMRPNSANRKVSAPLQRYVGYVGESNGHGAEDGLTVEDGLTFDSDAFEAFGDGFEFDTTEDFGFKGASDGDTAEGIEKVCDGDDDNGLVHNDIIEFIMTAKEQQDHRRLPDKGTYHAGVCFGNWINECVHLSEAQISAVGLIVGREVLDSVNGGFDAEEIRKQMVANPSLGEILVRKSIRMIEIQNKNPEMPETISWINKGEC